MYNLLQILGALHYCHSVGVVHKDVKLENILLDKNNNIKITDSPNPKSVILMLLFLSNNMKSFLCPYFGMTKRHDAL